MRKIEPIAPGEVLLEDFLKPLGITQYRLAKSIKVPPSRIKPRGPVNTMLWPDLPSRAFVSGRVAQEADVKCGDAVFYTQIDGGSASWPAQILIPQYAYLIADDSSHIPVVVVQAETNDRATILGLRDVHGKEYAVTEAEVILLGQEHP